MPKADETKSGLASDDALAALLPDAVPRAIAEAVPEAVTLAVPPAFEEAAPAVADAAPAAVADAVPAAFALELPLVVEDAVPPAVADAVPTAIEAELSAVPLLSPAPFESSLSALSAELVHEIRASDAPLITQLEQLGVDAPIGQLRTDLPDVGAPVDRLLPVIEGLPAAGSFVPAAQA
jgi:hypothetical protein